MWETHPAASYSVQLFTAATRKKLNIDRSHLSHIESGERGVSLDLLIQFSEIFHVSLDYIILGKNGGNLFESEKRNQLKCEVSNLIDQLEVFKSLL